jgi:non-heme chloroperoxidase
MSSVQVNGTDLWYNDQGEGDAVLVIHGGGNDGRMWATDLAPLVSTHRIITINRRGYPGSGPATNDWKVHADDAAAFIMSLDIAPAVVVAHSAGAIVALDLATRRPELVRQLVLLDPAVGLRSNVTPQLAFAFAKMHVLRRLGRDRQALDTWLRFATSYSTGSSAFERMGKDRRERLRTNRDGIFADLSTIRGSDIRRQALMSMRVPVTIVTAELSPSFLQKASTSLARHTPAVTTRTLQGAGHAMSYDQPTALIAELRQALTSASPAATRTVQ